MPSVLLEAVLLNSKLNELSLDVGAVYEAIKSHYLQALVDAESQLIGIMQEEIQRTTHGQAPGKPEWRNEISGMLKEVYREITDSTIEVGVGQPDSLERSCQYVFVRAMIIAEGSGSAVGGSPITAGPPGRTVWNNDLSSQHASNAKSEYTLPAAFNQRGNHFVDNAVKRMQKHFSDVLNDASSSLPDSVFYGNVIVSQR